MDSASLFGQAKKYRALARGINDKSALAVLEQMACEYERRARAADFTSTQQNAVPAHGRRKQRSVASAIG